MFLAIFVLKYTTQTAGSRASNMVHNCSRFWDVDYSDAIVLCILQYFDTQAVALGGKMI